MGTTTPDERAPRPTRRRSRAGPKRLAATPRARTPTTRRPRTRCRAARRRTPRRAGRVARRRARPPHAVRRPRARAPAPSAPTRRRRFPMPTADAGARRHGRSSTPVGDDLARAAPGSGRGRKRRPAQPAASPFVAVADAADGHDPRRAGRVGFELRTQALDVHVERLRVAEVVRAPDAVDQHVARQHAARRSPSAARAARTPSAAARPASPRTNTSWRPASSRTSPTSSTSGRSGSSSSRRGHPAQRGAHARDELAQPERLRHVVVGADLEPDDRVDLGVARGHHDDRHARTRCGGRGTRRRRRSSGASRRAARARACVASKRAIASGPSAAVSTRKPSRCERDRQRVAVRLLVVDDEDERRISHHEASENGTRRVRRSRSAPGG